jgi:methionine-rich copper-binding protein CopC
MAAGNGMVTRRLACAMAPALLLLAGQAASAHAVLEASTPAPNATVAAGPVAFRLQYNSRVDAGRSRLRLVMPDHSESALPIGADSTANVLTATATLAPGAYTLRWQVLAVDGHITHGAVAFAVRAR